MEATHHSDANYNGITGACLPEHAMTFTPTSNMLDPNLARDVYASMEAADLMFETDIVPDGFTPGLLGKTKLVQRRTDKDWNLGLVSDKYHSFQQSDVARVFQAVLEAHPNARVMKIFSGDANMPGSTCFMQIDLGGKFEPVRGRTIKHTLIVYWGHAGLAGVRAFYCAQDVTCTNMISGLLASAKGRTLAFNLKHQRNMDAVINLALEKSGLIATEGVHAMEQALTSIGRYRYHGRQALQAFVRATYPVKDNPAFEEVKKWQEVEDCILYGAGHRDKFIKGTGFQLLSGVSEYEQYHNAGSRSCGDAMAAARSRWSSVTGGEGSKAIARAYQHVQTMVAA